MDTNKVLITMDNGNVIITRLDREKDADLIERILGYDSHPKEFPADVAYVTAYDAYGNEYAGLMHIRLSKISHVLVQPYMNFHPIKD